MSRRIYGPRCVAAQSSRHRTGNPELRCLNEGRVHLGSGNWVCKQHHTHGWIPHDLGGGEHQAPRDDAQTERARRVASGWAG